MSLSDENILAGIVRHLLLPRELRAIRAAALAGAGERRDLPVILGLAGQGNANKLICAACFGFLPTLEDPKSFVDMSGDQNCTVADLPKALEPAFAIFRWLAGPIEGGLAYDLPKEIHHGDV